MLVGVVKRSKRACAWRKFAEEGRARELDRAEKGHGYGYYLLVTNSLHDHNHDHNTLGFKLPHASTSYTTRLMPGKHGSFRAREYSRRQNRSHLVEMPLMLLCGRGPTKMFEETRA